ncbi:hypothetical protein HK097_009431 [Rhizophlyctis rosea]|uniref:NAD-dependent epimerase/dehydratase domain-containing protein n=1 Tax=Rhizophlyctis rosea TaxID=64517 RepID=A0AAD5SB61_9FUNG|nr:hypothetical protein HK097_009431 [Rhizophlyctis rosea]
MEQTKILITGVTGYIGGSLLISLLQSANPLIQSASITGLVRGEDKATVLRQNGIKAELFSGFEDLEGLRKIASGYDRAADKAEPSKAMILGLADRQKATGRQTHFIHESGTSNLGDRPITGLHIDSALHTDSTPAIFTYLQQREALISYDQRTADLTVLQTGLSVSVKTYIIMAPTIFGIGSGHFKKISIQIPIMIRSALKRGQAEVIGSGDGCWTHVHIEDLVSLYELLLGKVLKGEEVPNGEEGMYFAETGEHSWGEISRRVGVIGEELGVLKTKEVVDVTLEDVKGWCGGSEYITEVAFASNARCLADRARSIGWVPVKTHEDWESAVREDFEEILKE